MSNKVKLKIASTIDEAINSSIGDIVFCEEDKSLYTHGTRYGSPTIDEIGSENPAPLRSRSSPTGVFIGNNIILSLGDEKVSKWTNEKQLPSIADLEYINSKFDEVNELLVRAGGTELVKNYYWSCDEGDDPRAAWAFNFSTGMSQLGFKESKLTIRTITYLE